MSDTTDNKSDLAAPPKVGVNGFFGQDDAEEAFLYDPSVVQNLDFSQSGVKFNPQISPRSPGSGLLVRPLSSGDFERGFLALLGQLTKVGNVSKADYLKRFFAMKNCNGTYYTTVIVDTERDVIIGAASLIVEKKFIHDCAVRGLIEEVVVNDEYRGKQLGKLLVTTLVELGKVLGCYKITLNCTDEMIKFYNGFGFVAEKGNANFLMIRVPQKN